MKWERKKYGRRGILIVDGEGRDLAWRVAVCPD